MITIDHGARLRGLVARYASARVDYDRATRYGSGVTPEEMLVFERQENATWKALVVAIDELIAKVKR